MTIEFSWTRSATWPINGNMAPNCRMPRRPRRRQMRSWTLAGAFDAGHIRGGTPGWERELNFHQLEMTGHDRQLEADYRLFREEFGLSRFRDGAWLSKSYPAAGTFDWNHLDRLASISNAEVTLSLCHYEWLPWIAEE